jgi:hypothetical protein
MTPLDADQAEAMLRGITSAVRYRGRLTDTQTSLLASIGTYLLGIHTDPRELDPISPADLADAVSDQELRLRAVHGMLALEIIANPVPADVSTQVEQYAEALHLDEGMLSVARDYANGAMDVAMGDLIRNSYVAEYHARQDDKQPLPETGAATTADPQLAAKWEALQSSPNGSHGRTVWEFYQMRGFAFSGRPWSRRPAPGTARLGPLPGRLRHLSHR